MITCEFHVHQVNLSISTFSYNMNDNPKNNILMSVPTLKCYSHYRFSHYSFYYMFCNCQEQLFFNLFQSEILRRHRNRTQHHSALQILAEMFHGGQSLCQQFSHIYQHPKSSSKGVSSSAYPTCSERSCWFKLKNIQILLHENTYSGFSFQILQR